MYIYKGVLFLKAHMPTSRKPQYREQTLICLALIEFQFMLSNIEMLVTP